MQRVWTTSQRIPRSEGRDTCCAARLCGVWGVGAALAQRAARRAWGVGATRAQRAARRAWGVGATRAQRAARVAFHLVWMRCHTALSDLAISLYISVCTVAWLLFVLDPLVLRSRSVQQAWCECCNRQHIGRPARACW
eukprot:364639-Chlamydomonas_euryale.AAC.35